MVGNEWSLNLKHLGGTNRIRQSEKVGRRWIQCEIQVCMNNWIYVIDYWPPIIGVLPLLNSSILTNVIKRDQLVEEMEEAFSNFKVSLNPLTISCISLVYSILTPFSAGSQWLQEHFQGCQHTNHHLHHVVRSLHFLTGRQHFLKFGTDLMHCFSILNLHLFNAFLRF